MTQQDPRLTLLEEWLARAQPGAAFTLSPASADASFRRYFRARFEDGRSLIVMDAPPGQEDCRPFVRVAQLLREAGLHAPLVVREDFEKGFLLLSDLGQTTYLSVLDAASAPRLFDDATSALVTWQLASRKDVLPPYDEALLRRELMLFPDWYLARHVGLALDPAERSELEQLFAVLIARATGQPAVFVHRDYMPRNLMVADPNPGILDFQDAVYGPITYDVVSLFKDAFVSWSEEQVLDWTIRYWEKARRAGLPVADFAAFHEDFEWMGLQRHLKVLGIFARLAYRDSKHGYLSDTPRFVRYVRNVAERYRAMGLLVRILDRVEGRPRQAGLTF
jgi:aminoglycoside/choline kinase family phosphotransferase